MAAIENLLIPPMLIPNDDSGVILAEYEQLVAESQPMSTVRSPSERLRALEQLKTDGLINEEEYNSKRTEILGEL